jgi:hypothetical protein
LIKPTVGANAVRVFDQEANPTKRKAGDQQDGEHHYAAGGNFFFNPRRLRRITAATTVSGNVEWQSAGIGHYCDWFWFRS